MVLVSFGRRTTRPSLLAVPAAAVAALALGVIQHAPEAALTPAPAEANANDSHNRLVLSPRTELERLGQPQAGQAEVAPRLRQKALTPRPTRTELKPPALVDPKIADAGTVYVERRYEEESFEESLARCIEGTSKITLEDPLAEPCA